MAEMQRWQSLTRLKINEISAKSSLENLIARAMIAREAIVDHPLEPISCLLD